MKEMVKSAKDIGVIYGLQQLGYSADYALKYLDTQYPLGFMGQPFSLWGDILGTVGGVLGALWLEAPYDLAAAMVGSYLSTDLWNQLARLVPKRYATPPPLVYTPPGIVPTLPVARGRYIVTY